MTLNVNHMHLSQECDLFHLFHRKFKQSMEIAPAAVDCMLKSGHEIAAHSYTQDALMAYLSPDEERQMIQKCVDVFKKLTGAPPKGWLSPVLAPSANTEELIAEAKFLWYGDYNNIDLPFRVEGTERRETTGHSRPLHALRAASDRRGDRTCLPPIRASETRCVRKRSKWLASPTK